MLPQGVDYGVVLPDDAFGGNYTCHPDYICEPDNLAYMDTWDTLVVYEDCAHHQNNFMFALALDDNSKLLHR